MEKKFSQIFSIFSEINRIKIYSLLLINPKGLYVCELNNLLNLPYYTISKNLKEIENIGLIESKRYGKYILYMPTSYDDPLILKFNSLIEDITKDSDFINKVKIDQVIKNRSAIQCQCDITEENK